MTDTHIPSAPVRKRAKNWQDRRIKTAWILVFPALAMLALVAGWPLLRTIFFSFTDAMLDATDQYNFVGLRNYIDPVGNQTFGILADPLWWLAVGNTLYFSVISVSLELVLGMLMALLMNQNFKGKWFVRTAVLVPWTIPTIVTAKIWSWLFNDQYGAFNDILMKIGLIAEPLAWVAEPDLSMWAVIMADVWKTTPFMALMLLAALQMIPGDLYEAARIDGANAWQRFKSITVPLILPATIVALIFRAMDALRVFDLIYVLTSNSEATVSVTGYARDQLVSYQQMGAGSAASVLVFMLVAGIAVSFIYISRQIEKRKVL